MSSAAGASPARYELARDAFALFLNVRCGEKSLIEAATAAGVSKAVLFRALKRQPISSGGFLSLCLWMNENPFAFLRDTATGRTLAQLPAAVVSREIVGETRGTAHFE